MPADKLLEKLLFDYKGGFEVTFDDEDANVGYLTDNDSGKTYRISVSDCK